MCVSCCEWGVKNEKEKGKKSCWSGKVWELHLERVMGPIRALLSQSLSYCKYITFSQLYGYSHSLFLKHTHIHIFPSTMQRIHFVQTHKCAPYLNSWKKSQFLVNSPFIPWENPFIPLTTIIEQFDNCNFGAPALVCLSLKNSVCTHSLKSAARFRECINLSDEFKPKRFCTLSTGGNILQNPYLSVIRAATEVIDSVHWESR